MKVNQKYRIAITIEKGYKGISCILWLEEEDFENIDELAEKLLDSVLMIKKRIKVK